MHPITTHTRAPKSDLITTRVKCPECGIGVDVTRPRWQPRFTMPAHGRTMDLECRASDRVYRIKQAD